MADIPVNHGVVGTDGIKPIVDREPLFRIWVKNQLYLGAEGDEKYVPKIHDWVVLDAQEYGFAYVAHVDPFTLIPTLVPLVPKIPGYFSSQDSMTTDLPGSPSETFRIYMNTHVYPYSLTVDAACYIRGSLASYAKLFLGADASDATGRVISKRYDNSGNFIDDKIPLEMAAIDSHTNYATKVVSQFHCVETLKTDELVTLVVYSDDGHKVYGRQFLIEISDTITDMNKPLKHVREIMLKSIWMDPAETDLIRYPLNIPMNALNMTAVALYSDGSTSPEYPVDGTKFSLIGLDGRISSIPDHTAPLVLRYVFSDGETGASASGANNQYMTRPYRIINGSPDGGISVKLFGYPEWVSDTTGYRMKWFLLNMNRNVWYEVTDKVKFNEITGPFEPYLFGTIQRKSVTINLKDVADTFLPFNHTQVVDIVLHNRPSTDLQVSWSVGTEANDNYPRVGIDTYGKILSNKVNFASGCESKVEWLDKFYWRARPLTDPDREAKAPTPTHFAVIYGATETIYSVDEWNTNLTIGNGVAPGRNAYLRFMRREVSGDLQLAITGTILKFIV